MSPVCQIKHSSCRGSNICFDKKQISKKVFMVRWENHFYLLIEKKSQIRDIAPRWLYKIYENEVFWRAYANLDCRKSESRLKFMFIIWGLEMSR